MAKKINVDFEKLDALREQYEPLRKELHGYLEKTEFGYFIRHPFCNDMVLDLEHCALTHQRIDKREARADACFENQDWEGYLACIEVCFQHEWFAKDAHLLPDEKYWKLLSGIYQRQKITFDRRELFNGLFRSDRPGRENLMEPEEREVLARLPDVLTVYRGYSDDDGEGYANGIAWTLDRRQAVWCANQNRESDDPRVITGQVRKQDVWAYFNGGDILLPPEKVYAKEDRRAWCEKARGSWCDYIKPRFDVENLIRGA